MIRRHGHGNLIDDAGGKHGAPGLDADGSVFGLHVVQLYLIGLRDHNGTEPGGRCIQRIHGGVKSHGSGRGRSEMVAGNLARKVVDAPARIEDNITGLVRGDRARANIPTGCGHKDRPVKGSDIQ